MREPRSSEEVAYASGLARHLPAGARRALVKRAQKIHRPEEVSLD